MAISNRASMIEEEELTNLQLRIHEILKNDDTPKNPADVAAGALSMAKELILPELGDRDEFISLEIGYRYGEDGCVYASKFGTDIVPDTEEASTYSSAFMIQDEFDKDAEQIPLSLEQISTFISQIGNDISRKLAGSVADVFLYIAMNGQYKRYACFYCAEAKEYRIHERNGNGKWVCTEYRCH